MKQKTEQTVDKKDASKKDDNASVPMPKELEPVLKDLPGPTQQKILKAFKSVSIHQSFSGPIPPPNILKGYNDVVKDGAERIMSMAERQSNHRITLEDHAIREELRQSGRGQIFGFVLGIVGLGLATYLAIYGHEVIAGVFGTTTIVGLVAVFVIGKKAQKQEEE